MKSMLSQGKLEVRVEVVERDWAKVHPPENIAPPPPVEVLPCIPQLVVSRLFIEVVCSVVGHAHSMNYA